MAAGCTWQYQEGKTFGSMKKTLVTASRSMGDGLLPTVWISQPLVSNLTEMEPGIGMGSM